MHSPERYADTFEAPLEPQTSATAALSAMPRKPIISLVLFASDFNRNFENSKYGFSRAKAYFLAFIEKSNSKAILKTPRAYHYTTIQELLSIIETTDFKLFSAVQTIQEENIRFSKSVLIEEIKRSSQGSSSTEFQKILNAAEKKIENVQPRDFFFATFSGSKDLWQINAHKDSNVIIELDLSDIRQRHPANIAIPSIGKFSFSDFAEKHSNVLLKMVYSQDEVRHQIREIIRVFWREFKKDKESKRYPLEAHYSHFEENLTEAFRPIYLIAGQGSSAFQNEIKLAPRNPISSDEVKFRVNDSQITAYTFGKLDNSSKLPISSILLKKSSETQSNLPGLESFFRKMALNIPITIV